MSENDELGSGMRANQNSARDPKMASATARYPQREFMRSAAVTTALPSRAPSSAACQGRSDPARRQPRVATNPYPAFSQRKQSRFLMPRFQFFQ